MNLSDIFTFFTTLVEMVDWGTDINNVRIYRGDCRNCTRIGTNIDAEPFEWNTAYKFGFNQSHPNGVYFKSHNLFNYTEANDYCKKSTTNDSKAVHKLFEPDFATNVNVSNWARDCTKLKDKKNDCKNWIGIKWDPTDSKFKYESSNETVARGYFKYPENYIDKTHHQCKYRKNSHLNCTQKNNCLSCTNDYRVYAQITTNRKEAKWYLDKKSEHHAFICETTVENVPSQKLVVVTTRNTTTRSGSRYKRAGSAISLKDFFMVSGMIREDTKEDHSTFSWTGDQGIVEGNIIKLRAILEKSEFKSFRIKTKSLYDWKRCNAKFQQPCPYFYTAVASLVAPSILALFTFAIITCCSKCLKQELQQSFGVPWKHILILSFLQPLVPFLKFFMIVNHRFPRVRKIFRKIVNINEMTDEFVEVWIMYFNAFWLFNVVGEAIPQLVISCLFITFKGEWRFNNFDRTNPASLNNDMLILSTSLSIFSMVKGTAVGIRSFLKIRKYLNKMREQNETTLFKVLLNEKDCQNRPKMAIEYQPALTEESAEDQVLEKQEAKTYIFFNLRGNIERMETCLPNGTVLKSIPDKKALNDTNDASSQIQKSQ